MVSSLRQPYSLIHRSVYPISDLAAMSDLDGTTNDDTTSTVLDGSIPDMGSLDTTTACVPSAPVVVVTLISLCPILCKQLRMNCF